MTVRFDLFFSLGDQWDIHVAPPIVLSPANPAVFGCNELLDILTIRNLTFMYF